VNILVLDLCPVSGGSLIENGACPGIYGGIQRRNPEDWYDLCGCIFGRGCCRRVDGVHMVAGSGLRIGVRQCRKTPPISVEAQGKEGK